jgi:hypothetical protein
MKYTALALVLLVGCSEHVNVSVDCVTTAAPAVECDVKQTQGKTEVEVCWDFAATCDNGAVVKAARTCQKVKDGGTVKATIPGDKLDGLDKCGGSKPPTAKVDNLTLNGKPPEK